MADRTPPGSDRPATSAFTDAVLAIVAATRPGEVVTYGEVAAEAGRPGAARAVGHALRTHGSSVPWWRVVNARGRLVPHHEVEHATRLAAEGVQCRDGAVVDLRARVARDRS